MLQYMERETLTKNADDLVRPTTLAAFEKIATNIALVSYNEPHVTMHEQSQHVPA
jgi:hypothetical protein